MRTNEEKGGGGNKMSKDEGKSVGAARGEVARFRPKKERGDS
jgi:hypothetical protein